MTCDNEAKHLIDKALDVVSTSIGYKLHANRYADGVVCITTQENEVARVVSCITTPENKAVYDNMYFKNDALLLEVLMSVGSIIKFHRKGVDKIVEIKFSKMFGNTIDELKLNLDLQNN